MYAKEKMKKGVKIRLIVMSLSAVLPIILLILFDLPFFKDRFVVYSDLFVLRYAIFVLLEGYIVFKIYRYIRFFCDVEYADSIKNQCFSDKNFYLCFRYRHYYSRIL